MKRTLNRFWWLALLAPVLLLLPFACATQPDPWADEPGSPRIVVTIAPLSSFVRGVAGDRAAVKCLCTTTGPHHYETDYRDSRLMEKADAVFAIGLELDDHFGPALHRLSNRGSGLPYVKLGEKLKEQKLVHPMRKHVHGADNGDAPHVHGEWDPHVWLGSEQAVAMVELIRDTLCQVDEPHADEYRKNADAYVKRLNELHKEGVDLMGKKTVKRLISFHDAFQYFADSYGLEIAEVIELAPGEAPGQKHFERLCVLCRSKE
jgi:ABC-type Zn uptake system ZnuABC Zn-binding protein ZnuA